MASMLIVFLGPLACGFGAFLGEEMSKTSRFHPLSLTIGGSVIGCFSCLTIWLLAHLPSSQSLGIENFQIFARIWTAHAILVLSSAVYGICLADEPGSKGSKWFGALVFSFLGIPFSLIPLALLTLL